MFNVKSAMNLLEYIDELRDELAYYKADEEYYGVEDDRYLEFIYELEADIRDAERELAILKGEY